MLPFFINSLALSVKGKSILARVHSFPCHREATASPLQMFSFLSHTMNLVSLLPLPSLYWASLPCAAPACRPGPSPGSTESNCTRALLSSQQVVLGRGLWLGGTGISVSRLCHFIPVTYWLWDLAFVSLSSP